MKMQSLYNVGSLDDVGEMSAPGTTNEISAGTKMGYKYT